jgi:hypothetical protein
MAFLNFRTSCAHVKEPVGAMINRCKSTVLRLGLWDRTQNVMGVPYVSEAKILGIRCHATVQQTSCATWAVTVNSIKGLAQEIYLRDLGLLSECAQFMFISFPSHGMWRNCLPSLMTSRGNLILQSHGVYGEVRSSVCRCQPSIFPSQQEGWG